MLKKILHTVSSGKLYSRAELASKLNIGENFLAGMIEYLVRKGYLEPLIMGYSHECRCGTDSCGNCRFHTFSSKTSIPVGWRLTDKGFAGVRSFTQ